jgi:drug/metabolite transporter (DMT)-like permease
VTERSGVLAAVLSSALGGVGAAALALVAWWRSGFAATGRFGSAQWTAIGYLGVFGAALVFYLWAFALERTTRVS